MDRYGRYDVWGLTHDPQLWQSSSFAGVLSDIFARVGGPDFDRSIGPSTFPGAHGSNMFKTYQNRTTPVGFFTEISLEIFVLWCVLACMLCCRLDSAVRTKSQNISLKKGLRFGIICMHAILHLHAARTSCITPVYIFKHIQHVFILLATPLGICPSIKNVSAFLLGHKMQMGSIFSSSSSCFSMA